MEKLNTLEIPVEIKLDARGVERHHDFNHLRTWTSIICRIEFVKTFPSFMKLTLITPKANDSSSKEVLVLRINIPGLLVQLATSRTKKYSYGMFWKANRKKCCAFLAFETQFDFEQHIQWVKYWIKFLEYYRKDFLLQRRVSNDTTQDISEYRINESLSSNINNTQNVKDIKEILGPLPKVPDSLNESWVRRQSRISGIYEEIGEARNNTSRESIVSGVYEDVIFENDPKLDDNLSQKSIENRKRVNTNEFGVSRSHTNTEADIKKKWWTLRGLTKRFDGQKRDVKSELEDFEVKQRKVVSRQFKTTFQKSNRNSFSTPDLSQLPDTFINCHRGEVEFLNISFESISNGYSLDQFDALSISHMREPVHHNNILCTNSSSVNFLTTSDCSASSHENGIEDEPIYQVPKNIPIRLIDETTGYCIMGAPLKQDLYALKKQESIENDKEKQDTSSHYLKMDEVRVELRKKPQGEEPIYANIEKKPTLLRYSVEEKLPSYFPNEHLYQKPKLKPHYHTVKSPNNRKPSNIYSPTPRKHNRPRPRQKTQELNNSYENAMLNQIDIEATPKDQTRHEPQQYGTLPHKSTKSFMDKMTNMDGKNHFGSLPRFKKIDFSPLRVKLNNMFLRYNNGKY